MRHYFPRFYVEGFVDADERGDGGPFVWVHRTALGMFMRTPVVAPDGARHFNVVEEGGLDGCPRLEERLAAIEPEAARLVTSRLPAREPLSPAERDALASFFALLGIRLSSRVGDLAEDEAIRGYEELERALREMGWVFWEPDPHFYFVSSNSPLHVAFPRDDGMVQGMELHAPSAEITLPLGPRLALHATWKRRGELWRRASEEVLLELNARTLLRATRFVLAPKPAIPL